MVASLIERLEHRKIGLIEGNAKCRYLIKLICKRTLRQVLSEAQNPISTLTHCTLRVESILIHTGKGGRVEQERRGEGQQFTK
jgi:hypothetical protein